MPAVVLTELFIHGSGNLLPWKENKFLLKKLTSPSFLCLGWLEWVFQQHKTLLQLSQKWEMGMHGLDTTASGKWLALCTSGFYWVLVLLSTTSYGPTICQLLLGWGPDMSLQTPVDEMAFFKTGHWPLEGRSFSLVLNGSYWLVSDKQPKGQPKKHPLIHWKVTWNHLPVPRPSP